MKNLQLHKGNCIISVDIHPQSQTEELRRYDVYVKSKDLLVIKNNLNKKIFKTYFIFLQINFTFLQSPLFYLDFSVVHKNPLHGMSASSVAPLSTFAVFKSLRTKQLLEV